MNSFNKGISAVSAAGLWAIRSLTVAALLWTACAANAQLNIAPYKSFSGAGAAQGATNTFAVASVNSYNGGEPVVTYIDVTSDLAGSILRYWTATNIVGMVSNSTTTLYFNGIAGQAGTNYTTNLFTISGAVLCLRHAASDTYEMLECTTPQVQGELFTYVTNTTSAGVGGGATQVITTNIQGTITVKYAPLTAAALGDTLYLMSPGGGFAVGAASVNKSNAGGVYSGTQQGTPIKDPSAITGVSGTTTLPLMMSLPSTSAGSINSFNVIYQ